MARPGISYDDVKTAAESLLQHGEPPTIQRIREQLGTGSNTTIATHLKRWQQALAATPRTILPPAVPEAVTAALDAFWQVAVEQADSNYQKLRNAADEQVKQAEEQRDQALAEQRSLQKRTDNVERRLAISQQRVRELEDALLMEQQQRAAVEARVEDAEQRSLAAGKAVETVKREALDQRSAYENELRRIRAEADTQRLEAQQRLQYERERGEANETRLLQQLDQAKTEHNRDKQAFTEERKTWSQRESKLDAQRAALQDQAAALREQLAAVQKHEETLITELRDITITHTRQNAEHLRLTRLLENLRGKLRAAAVARRDLEHQLADCRAALQKQQTHQPDSMDGG